MNVKLPSPTRGDTADETLENLFMTILKTNRQLEYILNNLDGYLTKNPSFDVPVIYE